jgi:AraC family transcriptional regulator
MPCRGAWYPLSQKQRTDAACYILFSLAVPPIRKSWTHLFWNMNFLGKILREKHNGPFRITETSYSANAALAMHQHETAYLSFLLAGAYVEVSGPRETACSSGTVIWHPPKDAHADRFHSTGGHLLNLEISETWLRDAAQELKPHGGTRTFCGGLPFSLGLHLYRELQAKTDTVEDLANEVLSFFFTGPADREPPAWFKQALDLASETYDHPLSLTLIAREVGVHPVHLARSSRRFLGCTFGDHLAKVRLRRAFELLLFPKNSIANVAHSSGFADHAHLCRTFKKSTGLTPSTFRRGVLPRL